MRNIWNLDKDTMQYNGQKNFNITGPNIKNDNKLLSFIFKSEVCCFIEAVTLFQYTSIQFLQYNLFLK